MKKKVILYNPKAVFFDMPLALLAVASSIDKERFDVQIIEGRVDDNPTRTIIQEGERLAYFGVTVLTGSPIQDALEISRFVKRQFPNVKVVWGGWHTSLFPTQTLEQEPSVDITVQGQGEQTFSDLLNALESDGNLKPVKGCSYRDSDGEICKKSSACFRGYE